jgi:two-component system, cell cycle response regulator DivK
MKRLGGPEFSKSLGATAARPKVLVIEDNDLIMKIYRAIFQQLACRVTPARTIAEALALLTHEQPDLIVVDLWLPDGSGIDATRAIRAQADLKDTPLIVVTTGAASSEDEARATGCSACISKPIRVSAFIQLVRQYLDKRPSGVPAGYMWTKSEDLRL